MTTLGLDGNLDADLDPLDTDLDSLAPLDLLDLDAMSPDTEAVYIGHRISAIHSADPVTAAKPRHPTAASGLGKVVIKERSAREWEEQAECKRRAREIKRSGVDVDRRLRDFSNLFFPTRLSSSSDVERARAICHACPVETECLAYHLLNWERGGGIYGGETDKGRRKLRRQASTDRVLEDGKLVAWLEKHGR